MSLKPSPQAAAQELLRRRRARRSLIDYAKYIEVPGAPVTEQDDEENFSPVETQLAPHHEIILSATQRCIERPRGRTMLFLPPGSAKSTYATVVSPTWAMGKWPGFKTIAVSYSSDLTRKFGRRMRSIVKQQAFQSLFGTTLSGDMGAADEWGLLNNSEFMGGGILSGITGNRADFIPIDDPVKGRQEADSEKTQKSTIDAYQEDILTRLKPQGSLMMTLTRWNQNDLAGSILPEDWAGESGMIECRDGETWEVICIPAQAERVDDLLGRKPGEYIWPEWFPPEHWQPFKRLTRTWNALYQQRPAPDDGDYWQRDWFIEFDDHPPLDQLRIYGASDYAVTSDGGDYTVHGVMGLDWQDNLWLLDLWREQASSDQWVEQFCNMVTTWHPIGWAEESGQIKGAVGPFLVRRMLERQAYVAREQFPTKGGDKGIRAQSMRGRAAMKGIRIPRNAKWKAAFLAELMAFPASRNDDQHDMLGLIGQLLDRMTAGKAPPKPPEEIPPEHYGKSRVPTYEERMRRKKGGRRI